MLRFQLKSKLIYTLLIAIIMLPVCTCAQYGGGISNGETIETINTIQLDGHAIDIYQGSNGRGEFFNITNSNQLNGDTANLYGGGDGRGEHVFATVSNQLNGDTANLYGGGIGRGEQVFAVTTNQLDGDSVDIYGGGTGRGEDVLTISTNQLDGNLPFIYKGGVGRGEDFTELNTNQLDGTGVSLYGGGMGRGETVLQFSTTALPITLLNFDAEAAGEKVKVTWQTSSESNSDYYIVERSADGVNWQAIGTVAAAGNSSTLLSYQLFDNAPLSGINYYRLKSVDKDTRFAYSGIAKVVFVAGASYTVSVYPNPAAYQFSLSLKGNLPAGNYSIRLMNASGQMVYKKDNLSGNKQTVDIAALAPGVYYLIVDTKQESISVKLVKL